HPLAAPALRGLKADHHRTDGQLCHPRRLRGATAQLQREMPQGRLAAHPLEQRAEPLPGPWIDDHPVLRRADDEPVALFPTAAEIFIDVGLTIADAHPADVVACRGRPDSRRGAFPGIPVLWGLDRLVGDLDLGTTGVWVDTRWMRGPDVGLLIEEP